MSIYTPDGDKLAHGAVCPVCHKEYIYETQKQAEDALVVMERRVEMIIKGIYEMAKARYEKKNEEGEGTT